MKLIRGKEDFIHNEVFLRQQRRSKFGVKNPKIDLKKGYVTHV
jgi:hypothetical protein